MSYIGIDQSLTGFGFAVIYGDGDGDHATETMKFEPTVYGSGIDRLLAVRKELTLCLHAVQARGPILHVCMEGYAANAKFQREQMGELGAVVKETLRCELNPPSCWPTIVPPPSLKKFVLGTGGGGKDDIKLGIYKKWGVDFTAARKGDDNQADAYGLAKIAYSLVHGAHLGYEKDVLAKLKLHTEKP